ncbi:cytochrome P450 [Streptomyces chartreusis]|uniref:cytochrome P450 n=1 Tax=Streptomyces chartreusis TaxID=1969 RepID=UPI00371EC1C0
MTEQIVPPFSTQRDRRCPFDPAPATAQADGPVSPVGLWNGKTAWLVTGYDEQRSVLSDNRLSVDTRKDGYPHLSRIGEMRRKGLRPFVFMDNPEHDRHRRMVTANFMVRRVEALRPRIQQIVDERIDALLAGPRPVDLVAEFGLPVPSLVICELLGVPYEDHPLFQSCSRRMALAATPAEAFEPMGELRGYLTDLLERKEAHPGDDVISRLVTDQVRTGALTREEAVDMCLVLLVAGHETTANMISLGTLALLENPAALAELQENQDASFVANAVEELLRYLSITHTGLLRVATEPVEVAGVRIAPGEGVIAANNVGNRDAGAFPDPDRLDLHRAARHHLAFGYGIHQCLGQPLARAELQVVYSTLYRRIPGLRLAIPFEDVPFKFEENIYGVTSLPVAW